MSEDKAQNGNLESSAGKLERRPKKTLVISNDDIQIIKAIAEKAQKMRKETGLSYEEFAYKSGINRNSYFRFEKSSQTGNNYTIALLLKVLKGLNIPISQFFKSIK